LQGQTDDEFCPFEGFGQVDTINHLVSFGGVEL
jgi:hypothetical protein